jgi:class 3 adenylate cyclase
VEVNDRDGIDLRLRVGLNSGQVIAGEIGSGSFDYTAIGAQVGMAQRMESVAPPGAVMLSASTARLAEGTAVLGEPEIVRIKGAEGPVAAHRLLGMGEQHRAVGANCSEIRQSIRRVLGKTKPANCTEVRQFSCNSLRHRVIRV